MPKLNPGLTAMRPVRTIVCVNEATVDLGVKFDRLIAAQDFERLVPVARDDSAIAERGKVRNHCVEDVGIVLDDEDDFPIGGRVAGLRYLRSGDDDTVGVRQEEADRRTPPKGALDRYAAARLASKAVDLR